MTLETTLLKGFVDLDAMPNIYLPQSDPLALKAAVVESARRQVLKARFLKVCLVV